MLNEDIMRYVDQNHDNIEYINYLRINSCLRKLNSLNPIDIREFNFYMQSAELYDKIIENFTIDIDSCRNEVHNYPELYRNNYIVFYSSKETIDICEKANTLRFEIEFETFQDYSCEISELISKKHLNKNNVDFIELTMYNSISYIDRSKFDIPIKIYLKGYNDDINMIFVRIQYTNGNPEDAIIIKRKKNPITIIDYEGYCEKIKSSVKFNNNLEKVLEGYKNDK